MSQDGPAQRSETPEPSEPPEPSELAETAEPSELAETAEPSAPAEPSEPSAPAEPEQPTTPGPRRHVVLGVRTAGAVILVALLAGGIAGSRALGTALSRTNVGDCLTYDQVKSRYTKVDCTDPRATYRLFAGAGDPRACVDVPGASRSYSDGTGNYCIGDKSADPATRINGVKKGDCVTLTGNTPARAACGAGRLPVILVVDDVPKQAGGNDYLGDVCLESGAKKVRQTYAWGISAEAARPTGSWDRLLCLGPPV